MNNLGLNERQIDALSFFKMKGEITSLEYAQRYQVTDRTARRDLSGMSDKELVKNESNSKFSRYIFP